MTDTATKHYQIAWINDWLLALAPMGDDPGFAAQLKAAEADMGDPDSFKYKIEKNVTLTNEDNFPPEALIWSDANLGVLVDENGTHWQYAAKI